MTPEEQEQEQLDLEKAQQQRRAQGTSRVFIEAPPLTPSAPDPVVDGGVRGALAVTENDNAGNEVTINRLSVLGGYPKAALRALDPTELQRLAREQGVLFGTENAPTLRKKFTDPEFARSASDDIEALAEIEKQMLEARDKMAAAQRPRAPTEAMGGGHGGLPSGLFPSRPLGFGDVKHEKAGMELLNPLDLGRSATAGVIGDTIVAGGGIIQSAAELTDEFFRSPVSVNIEYLTGVRARGELPKDHSSPLSRTATWAEGARKLGTDVGDFIAPEASGNMVLDSINAGARSAGQSLVWVAAAAAAGQPELAIGGLTAVTYGQKYGEYRDAGVSPFEATLGAGAQAGLENLTEKMPFHLLLSDITNKTPFGQMLMKQLFAENATEQAATLTQDMVDWAVLHPDKTVGEFMAERPEAALRTAIATTMATLIQTTVAVGADKAAGFLDKSRQEEKREADLSTAGREAMKNLVAAAAESKARERDPDQFKDYVDKLAQDGPVKSAYFSPEAFARAAQTMGKTPDELAALFGVEDQVQGSLAAGAKIEVPLGVFLEKIGGLSGADAILKDVTTSPFLLSEVEEAAIPEAARQRLLADADRVAQAAQGDATFAAGVETVRAGVEKSLTEAGRFVGMPNTLYSQLAATFYGNLAQQLGSTPEAMLQRFPLHIVGERITGGTTAASEAYDQADDENIAPKFNQGAALDTGGNQVRGRIGGTAEARSTGFNILDANPNTTLEQLKGQLGVSPRQASDIRKAWTESRGVPSNQEQKPGHPGEAYKQDQFTPLNELAVDDLDSIPEPLWNEHIKATKYAAYRLPRGIEEAFLPKGYVVVQSSAGNYAVREQHLKERMGSGEKFARMEQGGRGYYAPSTATIQLMAKADLSTFIHEIGHHFLELRFNVAKQLKGRQVAGETLTPGEQEVLDDVREWFRQAGIKPGNPGEGNALPQDVSWGLYFFDNILVDPTEAELNAFRVKQATASKGPVVKLFKTTAGRVVAFPGNEYSHADARMLLEVNDKPSSALRMQHATWDGGALKFQSWYDVTGTLADEGQKFAQLGTDSFKTLNETTAQERSDWFDSEVEQEVYRSFTGARTTTLKLRSDPSLKHPDIDIVIGEITSKDGHRGVKADLFFNGRTTRDPNVKPTAEDLRMAHQVFVRAILALQVYSERKRPAFISFVPSVSRTASRAKLYDAILRRYDFGYEARIFSTVDIVATATETTRGVSKAFMLVRPDLAAEIPLELSNAEIRQGDWFGEPSTEKRRVITEIVRPGRPDRFNGADDRRRAGDSAGDTGQSYAQGRPRRAVEVSDDTIDRASKELNEKQFEAWKQASAGVSNEDIAVSMGGEDGDVTPAQVGSWIFEAKERGYAAAQQPRGLTIGGQTLHVIAMSARGNSLSDIAEAVYPDRPKDKAINLVKQIRFQRKALIEQWKAKKEGSFAQGPIFYSALKRAAEGAKQAKAPAADWKAILKKAEGVKAEEIEAVGLFDYLDMLAERGEKQIPREDVVAFLDANGVRVVDVLLGPPGETNVPSAEVAPTEVSAEDRADYEALLREHETSAEGTFEDALVEDFEDNRQVFIESNNGAHNIYERAGARLREAAKAEYYQLEEFEGSYIAQEEPLEGYNGEGDPPMVWVVRNRFDWARHRGAPYGEPQETEDEAQSVADDMNSEEEADAASAYADAQDFEDEIWSDDRVYEQIRELYVAANPEAMAELRNAVYRDTFSRIDELELYDRVNPEVAAAARLHSTNYPSTRWGQHTLVRGQGYRELLLTLDSHKGPDFTYDNHWRWLKNFVAHIRFSIVDNTVVIDELQSDWHQQGRDTGYQTKETTKEIERLSALVADLQAKKSKLDGERDPVTNALLDEPQWFKLSNEAIGYLSDIRRLREATPDAPFKDDAWAKLALKRMIRWAAENGHEAIAWTPGDVHAERWNMHRVVDKLNLSPVGQDKWALTGYKDGRTAFSEQALTREDVAEYVGKATADQLFAQPVEPKDGYENTQTLDITENDFMAGPGKGMRFFYDTRLVNEANKLGKKHGAKVGEKVFDHPQMQRPKGHGGVVETRTELTDGLATVNTTSTRYHTLPIPEEMAAAYLDGAPLFQPEQDGTPPGGNPLTPEEQALSARAMRELPPGSDEIDMWDAMSFREREPYHELWARQVEAYFFEGKAPTPKLKRMFDKFREWLLNVYKSIVNLNAPLSDEVRSIMDRMLASKQEIADAERNHALIPMFSTKPDAMSDQEWADYQSINQQATVDAEKDLTQRGLHDVKWLSNARSREMRRLQNEARQQRKAMGAEVHAEVMAKPVNVARTFFSRGRHRDGTKVSGKPKLSISALEAMYPEGSGTDWQALGYGQYGMLSKDGLHPDAFAGMFGYQSGDAMVRELLTAEPAADEIKGVTDQRMLERYGDLTDEASIARAADEAVYSSLRGKVLAAEYAALSAALGARKLLNEAAKTAAETLVRRLNASKLNANKFLAAERNAGRAAEAALRKNDLAGAAAAKKDQLLSFYIAKEVMAKQKEYDKAKLKFKQIIDAKRDTVSKSRNFDLVQASRAILAAYGMATMKHKPMDYMGAVKRYDPTLYSNLEPALLNALTSGQKLGDLTVEQFFGLRDVVVQLWDLSREEKLVEINGQKMALKDVTDELNLHMVALGADPNKPIAQAPTPGQRTLRLLEGAAASLRRVEAWARLMDKGTVGPFTKFVWRPISQAATRYRLDQTKYILKFRELFAPIEANLGNARIDAAELGYTFAHKAELLHAILHTGNASNQRKLLMGYRWAQERADGTTDTARWDAFLARMAREGTLTAEDYQFAQSVWDLLEETKPLAQEAHRRVFGRYFAEITADTVKTPFGDFKGGYVPAIYDDHHNTDVALKSGQDAIEGNDSSMFPAPTKGFTEARVEYNRPMQLDVRLLAGHLDKVLKFAHMSSPVRDVLRILRSPGVERHLHDLHPTAVEDMLLPWLVRSARQTNETPIGGKAGRAVTNFANGLRRRANMGLMFGNLVNVLQQPTGLFNAFTYKGVKKRYIGQAMARFLRNPAGIHAAVRALSPLIETRSAQQAIAMRDTLDTIVAPTGKFEQAAAWFERHTYFLQTVLQNQQDVVIWLGAYESAKSRNETEAEAAQFADGVIRQTQGSSTPEDISRFETGTGWQKILISMYGYFNMWSNQLSTEFRLAVQDQGLKKNKGRLLYVYVAGFMAPALLAQLIADAIRGDMPAPDDEDEGLAEWLSWFFGTQAKTAAAMVPIVGASVLAGFNAFNDKPYDDRVLSSPAVSAVETLVRVPKNLLDYLGGEGDLSRTTKDSLSLLTLLTGLPFQAFGRPLGYLADVAEGDTEPKDAVDVARGMVAGR